MKSGATKSGATLALRSENGKTGLCAVTYASIESTCAKTCALKVGAWPWSSKRSILTALLRSPRHARKRD